MSDCLVHRGPDAGGIHRDGAVGLAHRRLSIVDLETGDQPMFNEDRSVAVIFNGEIYNHERLRQRLQAQGHEFTSRSDTEVLVHLYEEEGVDFVSTLNGMFAFALWDADTERLLLARDHMGIKPLYIGTEPGGRIAFASELSALFPVDFELGGLDRTAVAEYFAFGYVPAPKAAFEHVSKLRPGELAVVSEEGVRRRRFYAPQIESVTADIGSAAAELRDLIEDAVACRLQADVPLGAFLSGGIDSSIVTGILAETTPDQVRTFSVGFDEPEFDETWAAREVASFHGADHHEFTVSPADVREVIDEVVPTMGEPFADSSILPTYVVSRETSRELTVALSGDGADELFAGYDKYRGEYYSRYYRAVPELARRHAIEPAVDRLPASRASNFGNLSRQLQKFVRSAGNDRAERQYHWMAITTPETADSVGLAVPERAVARVRSAQGMAEDALPPERADDLRVMQASDARFALPDGILSKVDRASMLNSLEVRVPFLDTSVFEYAMGLPGAYGITPTGRKRILKRAFADVLPESILERGKQGFEIPIGEWFKNELSEEFTERLGSAETDMVDTAAVGEIYREHLDGTRDHTGFLWSVYVFLRWHARMRDIGVL